MPPVLVARIRWHIEVYGFAPDGRLFRTSRNGLLQDAGYGEVWERARKAVLPRHVLDTDLAKDPSSLRPAGLSGQLSASVAPQTVARRASQRAGHSVEVLLRVYARFVHDTDDDANRRISDWLQQGGQARSAPRLPSTHSPHAADRTWIPAGQIGTYGLFDRSRLSTPTSKPPIAFPLIGGHFSQCGGARIRTWEG
ncbi:hypothetical protein [Streptomyces sp. enrichment culture]|uniref:hypothetical protein n=1 Tax=Streptomyces sp. enrichment culture TaxID=1795815 RepID=UPI003F57F8C9